MNLLAPLAAWFALTIPVIVLFYLLKRRRVVLRVPSTVLWRRYLAETQASAPFQKLRKNWLLFLQILLLMFAVFALTRPFLGGQPAPSSLRVLIIDASASMQSMDEEPSRFEAAKREARRWIDSLRPGQLMVLLQAGPRTDVRQSATSDKPLLRAALAGCRATDGAARMGEALRMAESLIRDVADAEIHLFSDGAVGSLAEFENHNLPLVYHRVGQRRNNVALTSLEVRPNPENPKQRAVFTSVANLTSAAVDTTVELEFDGEMIDARPITIPAGESASMVFVVNQDRDGVFRARHTATDDLAADNQATVMSLLPPPMKVLLVTRGNRFLERALRLAGDSEVTVAQDLPRAEGPWDLVVLDDVTPTVWPAANVFAVRVSGTNWFDHTGPIRAPAIVDWRSSHPLLRFVSLDNVAVAEAVGVKPPSWGNVLIEAPQGPLLVAGEIGRHRLVWIGFDLLSGTWPLRVSFPIFVANAVDWLNPATLRAERLNLRSGEPLRYELPEPAVKVEVKPPGGDWETVTLDAGAREAVYGATDRQGAYQLRWGTNQVTFAVRALDLTESDTTPRTEIPVGRFGGTVATSVKNVNVEIWRWLVGAALAILMVEWWYFHRRTA